MDMSKFDHLPDDLKEQVIKAEKAFFISQDISEKIIDTFNVCNLRVSATADGTVSISGIVDNDNEKRDIQNFVLQLESVSSCYNGLEILSNSTMLNLTLNEKKYSVTTLAQLDRIFKYSQDIQYVEFSFSGHHETAILLLKNLTYSFAIYLKFDEDTGFTTHNSKGKDDEMQDFVLTNGQKDEYPTSQLVDNKDGLEILKYYLLTGKMYPDIEWREE
ncbi:hypothetical protein IX38_12625 [Chryseobacterium luteum]|uniref:BON domain-containing protein n=2 Tax=Chryseobacterium luteum TaxID=421531 RepID=A0A085ZEE5_9FLAO|nr:hypothetical protein IX38_12625 [Chryseobacterium luteum]